MTEFSGVPAYTPYIRLVTQGEAERPRDINQLAALTLALALGEEQEPALADKNEKAAELGSVGGLKGGRARADAMTPAVGKIVNDQIRLNQA